MLPAAAWWSLVITLLLASSLQSLAAFISPGQALRLAFRSSLAKSSSSLASGARRAFAVASSPPVAAAMATSSSAADVSSSASSASTSPPKFRTLETLDFDNAAIRELPVDPETRNYVRTVPNACYSRVAPEPLRNPALVAASKKAMLELLELSPSELERPEFVDFFSGNRLLPGSETYAHCYCGHQFGFFSGQLGDGAAIALGEVLSSKGERWELQLKGAGPTPYSRRADGRKVLRSSIREYLCSEAMAALGVPTTRAGAVITSDTLTQRDIYYNGNVINERCTVVLRLAPTFFRFGSFEIVRERDEMTGRPGSSAGNIDLLRQMVLYVIDGFFPHITAQHGPDEQEAKVRSWYEEVAVLTARLVAKWQAVGFTHGVLNTDNMSVLGLTIDYGPYGFLEWYDPDYIPNGSDNSGRYAYIKQPEICRWNVDMLGKTLSPLLPPHHRSAVLARYDEEFESAYLTEFRAKLGLETQHDGDKQLIKDLLGVMEETRADFSRTFRTLAQFSGDRHALADALADVCASPQNVMAAMARQRKIVAPKMPIPQIRALWDVVEKAPEQLSQIFAGPTDMIIAELRQEMDKVEKTDAIDKTVMRMRTTKPEDKRSQDREAWLGWVNKYADRLAHQGESRGHDDRARAMNAVNPAFVLRSWIAQDAIEAAEKKDFSKVRAVQALLESPFDEHNSEAGVEAESYCRKAPEWADSVLCTCSS